MREEVYVYSYWSGFGGSVAGLRLVEKGYKVLTIEQGKRFNSKDFPKSNWNLPKYLWIPSLRFFGFQKLSFYTTASILSGTGVGGGSLVYANTLYTPSDNFHKAFMGQVRNWKKVLEPFYDKASFMLGTKEIYKINTEDLVLVDRSKGHECPDTYDTVMSP
jgi:cholesterol oxidase